MLDFPQTNPKMTADWRDHIGHGDIVSFRFPLAEDNAEERPKARPCLVLDIRRIGSRRYALLAYGTSSYRNSNVGYEIHVRKRAEFVAAGLNEPTKFVGRRLILASLTNSGFSISRETGAPVLGSLDGAPLRRMNAVRARIQAEADIASDRRSQRRGDRPARHRRTDPRPVTVEQRHPRRRAVADRA